MTTIQLPADATSERTLDVVEVFEEYIASRPAIASNLSILGFGFSGSGSNAAMAFTVLKDWKDREYTTLQEEVSLAQQAMVDISEGSA
ncbi:efflux RND transporter permease subunit, partial [Streptomyces brasiliscabiei]